MTHDRAHALLLDLAYGELSPEEAREVSRHAAECSGCAAELERIGALRARAALLGDPPAPAGDAGRAALVEAARRAVADRPTRRWFTRPATLSFGAAAAVIAIAAGVTLKLTDGDLRPAGEETGAAAPQRDVAAPPPSAMLRRKEPAPEAPVAPAPTRRSPPRPNRKGAAPAIAAEPPRSPSAELRSPAAPAPSVAAAPRSAAAPPSSEDERAPAASAPEAASQPQAMAAPPSAARERSPRRSAAPEPAARMDRDRGGAIEDSDVAGAATSQRVREDVERRRAAGELIEVRRQLRCSDVPVERVALVAGGARVVKLSERRGDGAVREGWYDAAGQLREARTSGEPGDAPSLPRVAPAIEALGNACTW